MQIHNRTNNIQAIRKDLSQSSVKKYLDLKYQGSKVLVGNFGFIIVDKSTQKPVKKYYITLEYFEKEKRYSSIISSLGIEVPKLLGSGKELIEGKELYFCEFENIRKEHACFQEMQGMDPEKLGLVLGKVHGYFDVDAETLVHGNLHQSNFFKAKEGMLGIFDFLSIHRNDREYDFATLFYNSHFDEAFLSSVLSSYMFRDKVEYKKIYVYTLMKIKEEILGNIYIDDAKRKLLKLQLLQIRSKLS